jgi:hypothetical protein
MNAEVVSYKGLQLTVNPLYNAVEWKLDNDIFSNIEKYITNMSLMMEFVIYNKPNFLIIDKQSINQMVPSKMVDFTERNIFDPITKSGVKKIIIVAKNTVFSTKYPFDEIQKNPVVNIQNLEDCYKWILSLQTS